MTVKISKPALNLREKLAELESNNMEEARIGSLVSDSIDAVAIDAESLVAGATALSSTLSVASGITATGGVYLGGTGAANLLDDYEEGTWTPTLTGATSGSAPLSVSEATYVKIGRQVTVKGIVSANLSAHTISGNVYVGGLPFTPSNSYAGIIFSQLDSNFFTFDRQTVSIGGWVNASNIRLKKGSSGDYITNSDLSTGSAAAAHFSVTYFTA